MIAKGKTSKSRLYLLPYIFLKQYNKFGKFINHGKGSTNLVRGLRKMKNIVRSREDLDELLIPQRKKRL